MNYFLKVNKNFLIYTFILLIIIPIFGIKFFISFLGNILLLLFLIPVLLLLLIFVGFNSYKSKINTCSNCGANLKDSSKGDPLNKKPSERIIEVKAEEIK